MANPEHIEILKHGVKEWNEWRKAHPVVGADLSGANLIGANLFGAKLSGAKLTGKVLREANLREANLRRANLSGADLSGKDLSGAKLREAKLRGAIIDERTNYRRATGCIKGVNGFYVAPTDSAALMTLTPPADSMKGANPSAV